MKQKQSKRFFDIVFEVVYVDTERILGKTYLKFEDGSKETLGQEYVSLQKGDTLNFTKLMQTKGDNMEYKFKYGQKVRIAKIENGTEDPEELIPLIGLTGTIKEALEVDGQVVYNVQSPYEKVGNFFWEENELEAVSEA